MFLKLNLIHSSSAQLFLWNLSVDGECSTKLFNSFTIFFTDLNFDSLGQPLLIKLFKDGRFVSPFLECWLDQNTNLILLSGNQTSDFVDQTGSFYQLKTFTKNGLNFRPSFQVGSQRVFKKNLFEDYCKSQTFILASVINFPKVTFRIFKGETLLKLFKSGQISPKAHKSTFEQTFS